MVMLVVRWLLKHAGSIAIIIVVVAIGVFIWSDLTTRSNLVDRTKELADTTRALVDARKTIVGLKADLVVRDTAIARLSREISKALQFGNEWKGKFNAQVAQSDATADRLSDREAELQYYHRMEEIGTLKTPIAIEQLQPQMPEVIRAGLKSANRVALGAKTLDSLSRSVGQYQAATERLGKGLATASQRFTDIATTARKNKKGGLWPFNAKRRKQNEQTAVQAEAGKKEVEEFSDLELDLNKKH